MDVNCTLHTVAVFTKCHWISNAKIDFLDEKKTTTDESFDVHAVIYAFWQKNDNVYTCCSQKNL